LRSREERTVFDAPLWREGGDGGMKRKSGRRWGVGKELKCPKLEKIWK